MWSMPDKVLRIVAGLLGACVLGGFVLGILSAPQRGRLPGEAVAGGAEALVATEARPFNTEELAPPKPPEPEAQEPVTKDEAATADQKAAPAEKAPPSKVPTLDQATPPDEVGDLIQAAPSQPEEPPF